MGAFLSREMLFWVPFSVDLALCAIQFPMFLIKGPQWFAQVITMGEGQGDARTSTSTAKIENDDDDDKKKSVPKFDSTYIMLYDTFLLSYSGYCAMMFYGLYSVLQHPETLLALFNSVMFGVILAKTKLLSRWKNWGDDATESDESGGNAELRKAKSNSLLVFYIPTYGGYCLLQAVDWYKNRI